MKEDQPQYALLEDHTGSIDVVGRNNQVLHEIVPTNSKPCQTREIASPALLR